MPPGRFQRRCRRFHYAASPFHFRFLCHC
jgi:hypothetical protein